MSSSDVCLLYDTLSFMPRLELQYYMSTSSIDAYYYGDNNKQRVTQTIGQTFAYNCADLCKQLCEGKNRGDEYNCGNVEDKNTIVHTIVENCGDVEDMNTIYNRGDEYNRGDDACNCAES